MSFRIANKRIIGLLPCEYIRKFSTNSVPLSSIATNIPTTSSIKKLGRIKRIINKITGFTALENERIDLSLLEKFSGLSTSLKSIVIPLSHPLNSVSRSVRDSIRLIWKDEFDTIKDSDSLRKKFLAIDRELDILYNKYNADLKEYNTLLPNVEDNWQWNSQTTLRISHLKFYFKNLMKVCVGDDSNIILKKISGERDSNLDASKITSDTMMRLSDCYLLGTSTERILEHFNLYPSLLTQNQLQESFYDLYDPEVQCISSNLLLIKGIHNDHTKKLNKYVSVYLLDKIELNTKSRCVFNWADPLFTGFKPYADDHTISIPDVIKSRHLYFKEGVEIGSHLMSDFIKDRKAIYAEDRDNVDTFKKGTLFTIGVILLDWLVCTI